VNEVGSIAKNSVLDRTVAAIMKQIYECGIFLTDYASKGKHLSFCVFQSVANRRNLLERLLRDTLKNGTDDRIQQFTESFTDLRQRFAEGSNSTLVRNIESGIVELQDLGEIICRHFAGPQEINVWFIQSAVERTKLLDGLPGADLGGVRYDAGHVCLPGTRRQLLDDIVSWVHDPNGGQLYWLSGGAGTGKSTVANSIADINP
jgi:hypothetical protein